MNAITALIVTSIMAYRLLRTLPSRSQGSDGTQGNIGAIGGLSIYFRVDRMRTVPGFMTPVMSYFIRDDFPCLTHATETQHESRVMPLLHARKRNTTRITPL